MCAVDAPPPELRLAGRPPPPWPARLIRVPKPSTGNISRSARESRKCFTMISSGSVMAVKFTFAFHFRSSARYSPNSLISSGDRETEFFCAAG